MRMRLVSSVFFVALLLKRCRLLCEALVAASCCFTFETSTMQKPRVFEAFQTKSSQLNLKNKNQRRTAWYLRHFRKNLTKNQDKKTMEKTKPETPSTHTQGVQAFDQKASKNKRHTLRGGQTHVAVVSSS